MLLIFIALEISILGFPKHFVIDVRYFHSEEGARRRCKYESAFSSEDGFILYTEKICKWYEKGQPWTSDVSGMHSELYFMIKTHMTYWGPLQERN